MESAAGWTTKIEEMLAFYAAFSPKLVCIWLSVWAIRRKSEADYPLNSTARVVRWSVVVIGFVLGYMIKLDYLRLTCRFAGLAFLVWPNLAYHLTNVFVPWPETEGRVTSFTTSETYPVLGYSFEFRGSLYGGRTPVKSKARSYSEGQTITIAYDPVNPDESKVVF